MSLKKIKKSLIARPSRNSFISDFECDTQASDPLQISHILSNSPKEPYGFLISEENCENFKSFEDCKNFKDFKKLENFQKLMIFNEKSTKNDLDNLQKLDKCDEFDIYEEGNDATLTQSKASHEIIDINLIKPEDFGYSNTITTHSKAKINRILRLFKEKNLRKMQYYYDSLSVFNKRPIGEWKFNDEIYYSTDFQCFDVMYGSNSQEFGFLNGFSSIKCCINGVKTFKTMMNLTNDCYSSVKCCEKPFKNSLILGLFSGPLIFVDFFKEKIVKKFNNYKENTPFSRVFQEETAFYAGNVEGGVEIFDYRMKNSVDMAFLEENSVFNPVLSIDVKERRLLAGNQEKFKIWDVRNMKNSLFSHNFDEKKQRKLAFYGENRVINAEICEEKVFSFDFDGKNQRKLMDFKGKKVKDMQVLKEKTVFLLENNENSQVFCCLLRKNKLKVENCLELEGKYERIRVGEDGEIMGFLKEDGVKIIGYWEKSVEKEIKGK